MIEIDKAGKVGARLDGTQLAVALIAWVVGGWKLVIISLVVMYIWAFATILFLMWIEARKAKQVRALIQSILHRRD